MIKARVAFPRDLPLPGSPTSDRFRDDGGRPSGAQHNSCCDQRRICALKGKQQSHDEEDCASDQN
jgi:hypothetical protein